MSEYKVIYTGRPETFSFVYDVQSYSIYNYGSPFGSVFHIMVSDEISENSVIKAIDNKTLDIKLSLKFSHYKILYSILEKYFYIDNFNYLKNIYDNKVPEFNSPYRNLFGNFITNIYNLVQSDSENPYIYKNYIKYAKYKDNIDILGYKFYFHKFNIENLKEIVKLIVNNIYENNNVLKSEMPYLFINHDYNIQNLDINFNDILLLPSNKYIENKNILFLHYEKDFTNEFNDIVTIHIISYYLLYADLYDYKFNEFIIKNFPLKIVTQSYIKFNYKNNSLVEYKTFLIPHLSLFEGFFVELHGIFPFYLQLSKEVKKRIIHIVGVKRNNLYKKVWVSFWNLFNIYDLDYYDKEFVEMNVSNEIYKDFYYDYLKGVICKNDIINELKIPLLLCERESRKVSTLPVDSKIKLDFSYPVIIITEE